MYRRLAVVVIALGFGGAAWSQGMLESSAGPLALTPVATGLQEPWAIGFLPGGAFLVTERDGALKLFPAPMAAPVLVEGLPEVAAVGQGGLLDILIPADFAMTREVWLTFAAPVEGGAATAVGKGILSEDGTRIDRFQTLFTMPDVSGNGRHFGSRLTEAADGSILVTIGDRGTGPKGLEAQDPQRAEGKVIHLTRDGQPATRLADALPGVFSHGHRNPQGATLDLQGRFLIVDHGPRGGDELNAPEAGRNYGWPVASFGINYNGSDLGVGTSLPGTEQPLHYWDPSIAPSGLMVYSGALIPDWRGDIFFGSLNSDFLGRLDPDTPAATGYAEERLASPETQRVRDVVEAPDGSIWFLSVGNGAAYRLAPSTASD